MKKKFILYAVLPTSYRHILTEAGFTLIAEKDETIDYAGYNSDLVAWLKDEKNAAQFKKQFGEKAWYEACESYDNITHSMQDGELLVMCFIASK